ncbi:MAG: zf-HC2 domain-containing protein [Vicinamibacteraceae bacterium]
MTGHEVSCSAVDDLLVDLVDDALDPASAANVELHVARCPRCGPLVKDLRAIRQAASALPPISPPAHVWPRIRAALQTEAWRDHGAPVARFPSPVSRSPATWSRMAAAAAVLIAAISAGLWSLWISRDQAVPLRATRTDVGDRRAQDLVDTVESEIALAAAHYEKAIAKLEEAARASGTELDPDVMATLKTNLALVDGAIEDSRRAVRAQPENLVAQTSLLDAFQRKVTLLQDTVALMREVRAEAAATPAGLDEG